MTNYNERLESILTQLEAGYTNPYVTYPQDDISHDEAKQAITSLIKELVAEAKPDRLLPIDLGELGGADGNHLSAVVIASVQLYNQAIKDYEANLLKALEEV